MEGRLPARRC
uniref:Uncharacterized protein n=1 Tax=Arundo donax TaxID=35708 RepID=A0A0A9A7M1_ARUDO